MQMVCLTSTFIEQISKEDWGRLSHANNEALSSTEILKGYDVGKQGFKPASGIVEEL